MPLVALAPLQPPDAVHVVALVDDQVSVELDPLATVVGLALKFKVGVGVGGFVTVTVVDACALAPPPEQISVKVLVDVSGAVFSVPLVDLVPDQAPDAEHCVAFVDDQVNEAALPPVKVCGFAASETLGPAPASAVAGLLSAPPPPHAFNTSKVNDAVAAQRARRCRQ